MLFLLSEFVLGGRFLIWLEIFFFGLGVGLAGSFRERSVLVFIYSSGFFYIVVR